MARKRYKQDPANRRLTAQENAMVNAYLDPECKSPSEAMLIGYPKSANWSAATRCGHASEVLARPAVAKAVEKGRERLRNRISFKYELTAERILDEYRRIALANITDVVSYSKKKGRGGVDIFVMDMAQFDLLSEESLSAIKKIKFKTVPTKDLDQEEGEEATYHEVQEVEIEMHAKQPALDGLAKHFNLFVERLDVVHSGTVGHVHASIREVQACFDAMTQDQREHWLESHMAGEAPEIAMPEKTEEQLREEFEAKMAERSRKLSESVTASWTPARRAQQSKKTAKRWETKRKRAEYFASLEEGEEDDSEQGEIEETD